MSKSKFSKEWEKAIENPAGSIRCPNCQRLSGGRSDKPTSFLEQDEAEFSYEPEPHHSWNEVHRCLSCGFVYTIKNGT